jgi:hypothetical protein
MATGNWSLQTWACPRCAEDKNSIKNTEMLEKYIYIAFQSKKIFF